MDNKIMYIINFIKDNCWITFWIFFLFLLLICSMYLFLCCDDIFKNSMILVLLSFSCFFVSCVMIIRELLYPIQRDIEVLESQINVLRSEHSHLSKMIEKFKNDTTK